MNGNDVVQIFKRDGADGDWLHASVEWSVSGEAEAVLKIEDGTTFAARESDLFECLVLIRKDAEPLGLQICCNGARKDAYPSRMNREMGGGSKVQIRRMGTPVNPREQVDTFGPADLADIATVEEQESCYREWIANLVR